MSDRATGASGRRETNARRPRASTRRSSALRRFMRPGGSGVACSCLQGSAVRKKIFEFVSRSPLGLRRMVLAARGIRVEDTTSGPRDCARRLCRSRASSQCWSSEHECTMHPRKEADAHDICTSLRRTLNKGVSGARWIRLMPWSVSRGDERHEMLLCCQEEDASRREN
jgi:hypothetical protein